MPSYTSLVLSATLRRNSSQNERSGHTPNIGNVFESTFDFKNPQPFQFRKKIPNGFYSPPNFGLPTQEKITPPYTSPDLAQNLKSDRLRALP